MSGCKTPGYHISNKETEGGSGWCVQDSATVGQEGCDRSKYSQITGDSHDYKDDNAVWVNAYLTDHTMYCKFKDCTIGMAGNPCTKVSSDCPGTLPAHALGWTKDTSGTCYITGCDDDTYTPDPTTLPQTCKL